MDVAERELIREVMTWWDRAREAWVEGHGSDEGFAAWFSEQAGFPPAGNPVTPSHDPRSNGVSDELVCPDCGGEEFAAWYLEPVKYRVTVVREDDGSRSFEFDSPGEIGEGGDFDELRCVRCDETVSLERLVTKGVPA